VRFDGGPERKLPPRDHFDGNRTALRRSNMDVSL
jgi:hypothetical protein